MGAGQVAVLKRVVGVSGRGTSQGRALRWECAWRAPGTDRRPMRWELSEWGTRERTGQGQVGPAGHSKD